MCEGLRCQRVFADACQSLLRPWITRRGRRRGRRPAHREDPIGGSVPGADDDPFDRDDPFEGSVPGADDDPFDRDDSFEGSVPGADDDPFDSVLPFAAKLYEPPAPISATVARAASGRSFLLMFHSFVW
jgi:hypothetical protein